MKIAISDRLRSFSHKAGHQVMVPGTLVSLQVFPTELIWTSPEGVHSSLVLDLKGPMDPFTVEQDLEAKLVRIYGQSQNGYFRMCIKVEKTGVVALYFEKTPKDGICTQYRQEPKRFFSGDFFSLCVVEKMGVSAREKLFLGIDKQKEWEKMRDRKDLREILPLWHALGSMIPSEKNTDRFFPVLQEAIKKKERQKVYDLLLLTYLAHFSAGLFPRKEDTEKQGIPPLVDCANDLLSQGSRSIRSLFFQENEEGLHFLPCLPSQFVCGKMVHMQTKSGLVIDMEWTKHRLRKMKIVVDEDQEVRLHFPAEVKSFRIRRSYKDRGNIVCASAEPFSFSKGTIWLDLFQR
jgi:hypothetical protein